MRRGVPPSVRPQLWSRLTRTRAALPAPDGRGKATYGDHLAAALGRPAPSRFAVCLARDVDVAGLDLGPGLEVVQALTRVLLAFEHWYVCRRQGTGTGTATATAGPSVGSPGGGLGSVAGLSGGASGGDGTSSVQAGGGSGVFMGGGGAAAAAAGGGGSLGPDTGSRPNAASDVALAYSPCLRAVAAVLVRTVGDECDAFWMLTWLSDRLMMEHHGVHRVGLEVRVNGSAPRSLACCMYAGPHTHAPCTRTHTRTPPYKHPYPHGFPPQIRSRTRAPGVVHAHAHKFTATGAQARTQAPSPPYAHHRNITARAL